MLTICRILCRSSAKSTVRSQRSLHLVSARHLHSATRLQRKNFVDTENAYAHSILESNPNYIVFRSSTYDADKFPITLDLTADYFAERNWHDQSPAEILKSFHSLVGYCKHTDICLSSGKFDSFVNAFTEKCFEFDDNQLSEALQCMIQLPECPSSTTRNFVECWNSLDDNCVERLKDWQTDHILYVCDLWYQLRLAKMNTYNWHAIKKLGRKLQRLSPSQLVQSMFYCNLLREPMVEIFDFEHNLAKCIAQLSLDEIGVMCMGFFKTQTSIKSAALVQTIIERLLSEIGTVSDITCVNLMKTLRYSHKPHHDVLITEILDRVVSQIPRLNLLTCLHVALMGSNLQMCHPKSLRPIVERFCREIKEARLKDMERISFLIGLYDFETESGIEMELCRRIVDELKERVPEIVRHPRVFVSCLSYLTQKGVADAELISSVLEPNFLAITYGKNVLLGREVFALDGYVQINMKDTYTGNRLPDKKRAQMGKLLTHYLPSRDGKYKLAATDTFLLEIKEAVQKVVEHCHMAHALPHFDRADNIVAYNPVTRASVDIGDNFPKDYPKLILTRDTLLKGCANSDALEIVSFVIGGRNNFVRNEDRPTGLLRLKLEQSRLVGFRPILVSDF